MSTVLVNGKDYSVNTIYCIGRNYVDHIAELKNETHTEPVVFLKPNASLLQSGGTIFLPAYSQSIHYECELTLLIGENCDTVPVNPLSIVAAYGVGLDLTARDIQTNLKNKGLPWTKAKGFRGAACVSEMVPAAKIPNPNNTQFSLHINHELRQQGQTSLMIYPIAEIIRELISTYSLRRGDLIFTGTPAGVGELNPGDNLVLDLAGGLAEATFHVSET